MKIGKWHVIFRKQRVKMKEHFYLLPTVNIDLGGENYPQPMDNKGRVLANGQVKCKRQFIFLFGWGGQSFLIGWLMVTRWPGTPERKANVSPYLKRVK